MKLDPRASCPWCFSTNLYRSPNRAPGTEGDYTCLACRREYTVTIEQSPGGVEKWQAEVINEGK